MAMLHPQPRDVVGLARRDERDRARLDGRIQRGDGDVLRAVQQQVAVDLVRADDQVALGAELGQCPAVRRACQARPVGLCGLQRMKSLLLSSAALPSASKSMS